jgi:subtilisin family serine protease
LELAVADCTFPHIGWPLGPKIPDSDPVDVLGHGTHVAGIIAGKTDWYVPTQHRQT